MDDIILPHTERKALPVFIPCKKEERSITCKTREGLLEYRELVLVTDEMALFIRELHNKHYSHESIVDECNKKWNKKWICNKDTGEALCELPAMVLREKPDTDTDIHVEQFLESLDKFFD